MRTCNDDFYNIGDKVYYKRRRDNKWHGPAAVVGRDSHAYMVKHSFRFCVVHPRDMQLYRANINDMVTAEQISTQQNVKQNTTKMRHPESETVRAQVTTFPERLPSITEEATACHTGKYVRELS